MSIFTEAFTPFDDIDPRSVEDIMGQQQSSRGRFSDVIGNILSRGRELANQPTLTAQDLFGEEIQRLSDSARSTANATKSALSRSLLASGGEDRSGATSVNLLRADQSLNDRLGQITDRFNTMATQISEARQRRGDSLLGRALQGVSSLFSSDTSRLNNLINRQTQQEQARKQRSSGFLGGLLSTGGQLAGSAMVASALCWVAEEIYPENPEKVEQIREFLSEKVGDNDFVGQFATQYALHGDQWAETVRSNPKLRKSARRLMDEFYEISKAA